MYTNIFTPRWDTTNALPISPLHTFIESGFVSRAQKFRPASIELNR